MNTDLNEDVRYFSTTMMMKFRKESMKRLTTQVLTMAAYPSVILPIKVKSCCTKAVAILIRENIIPVTNEVIHKDIFM